MSHIPSSLSRHIRVRCQPLPLLLFITLCFSLLSVEGIAKELTVHFIDIGQGDAALIVSPSGKTILLDSGPSKSWSALHGYIDALKIKKIDLLINTHPHSDHIGNAARAIERYHISKVMDSGFVHPIGAYRKMLQVIKERKVKLLLGRRGREVDLGGGAKLKILGPEEPLISGSRSDPNSNSIVFRITYKGRSALFTGDAESETEHRLLKHPEDLRADLLKVAHHGSKHASSESFLNAVKPKHAIISCGVSNRYGHPTPETLQALKQVGAQAWVTAQKGSVIAQTQGGPWVVRGTKPQEDSTSETTLKAQTSSKSTPATTQIPTQAETSTLINVNTASAAQLQTLPSIGAVISKRMIEARKAQPFTSPQDLQNRVRGIGAKTRARLEPLISF